MLVKHYAEDLGFEYITASNKEEFSIACNRFVSPVMTNKPIVFETFTDSADESNALEQMLNIVIDEQAVMKNKIKAGIKDVLGESTVRNIKRILGR